MIFTEARLGPYALINRLARSATAERGADERGKVAGGMVDMYADLARGGAGLIMTGHAYVRADGRTNVSQTGIHTDEMIPGLAKVAGTVHKKSEARIFIQISHAGRAASAELIGSRPAAPSPIPVRMSGENPREMSGDEIEELVELYTLAALRAQEAGFDGVQLHCAHGYLISQFLSPYTNKRDDEWGGSPEGRRKFLFRIVSEISGRAPGFPITVKINCEDLLTAGTTVEEFVETSRLLDEAGVAGIEVSAGIPETAGKIIKRNIDAPDKEGYLLYGARALKEAGLRSTILTVGGYRSRTVCEEALEEGSADIISLCRPLITEPDLPEKWRRGESDKSRCVSCSGCLKLRKGMTHCVYWNKIE